MYRDASSAQGALSHLLTSIQQRLDRLDQRIRWPGATHIDAPASPAPLPANTGTFTTYASLTLDPGAWLILAGTTFEVVTNGVSSHSFNMYARTFPATPGSEVLTADSATVGVTTSDGLVIQTATTLTAQGVVTFDLDYFSFTPGVPDATIINPYLIAFPA